MPTFTVHALPESTAEEALSQHERRARRRGRRPYPVRCCLTDDLAGAGVILASFRGESPYAAAEPGVRPRRALSRPRRDARAPSRKDLLRARLLSARAYDAPHCDPGPRCPGHRARGE